MSSHKEITELNTVTYTRLSIEGDNIETQLRDCRKLAADRGWTWPRTSRTTASAPSNGPRAVPRMRSCWPVFGRTDRPGDRVQPGPPYPSAA